MTGTLLQIALDDIKYDDIGNKLNFIHVNKDTYINDPNMFLMEHPVSENIKTHYFNINNNQFETYIKQFSDSGLEFIILQRTKIYYIDSEMVHVIDIDDHEIYSKVDNFNRRLLAFDPSLYNVLALT